MEKTRILTTKLGSITGAVLDNVVQYRGIPYARIPGRFKDPVGPVNHLGKFDATKWGPMAVQQADAEEVDARVLNHKLTPMPEDRKVMSELECTNLVIVTPYTSVHKEREQDNLSPTTILLPTIVWVHGGANRIGSANFMAYDMRRFVKHSIDVVGKPVIVVSLNHRLGTLGYLACAEVEATGNYGLKDQVLGLRWVKEHIQEFGGDPDNITFMGESAGGIAGSLHLYSEVPLFKRAILLSGLAGLLPPRPVDAQEMIYLTTCEKLDFADLPPTQRAERMLNISATQLAKIAFQVEICPTSDGEFIPIKEWVRHENFKPLPDWCESLVIGSCKDEWGVMQQGGAIKNYTNPLRTFKRRISRQLTPEQTSSLLSRFELSSIDPREETVRKLYVLISEYGFRLPAYMFTRYWSGHPQKAAYFAQFTVRTPLEGPNKGRAHHGVDVVFSFFNQHDEFPATGGYRELEQEVAAAWCSYAYGEAPWSAYDEKGEKIIRVFDVGGRGGERKLDEWERDEWETWKVMEEAGVDKIWETGQAFLAGPGEGGEDD
ncbi:Alpha/Beta hydrolase protein [Morchella snyderi]|nr:Alpha/Beta hydrolase protein [Morchella snyderi]